MNEIIYGAPVVLFKSEGYPVLKHNKTAQDFQDSLGHRGQPKVIRKEKACNRCSIVKPLKDYSINKSMKDGTLNECKLCIESRRLEKAAKAREKYKSITRAEMDHRNETGRKGRKERKK